MSAYLHKPLRTLEQVYEQWSWEAYEANQSRARELECLCTIAMEAMQKRRPREAE